MPKHILEYSLELLHKRDRCHNRIWRRTKSWGEGGYPIEREAADGSYSLFELALKQLAKYLGPTDSAR